MDDKGTTNRNSATRVLIVDDHPVVREGLRIRIAHQDDLMVCGEAAGIFEALRVLEDCRPDVAVVDISLEDGDGLDLIRRIKARDDHVRMLVWSMYPDALYAERALRAGAMGYINKQEATTQIIEAIRVVLGGGIYLNRLMTEHLLRRSVGGQVETRGGQETLTDRELEVLRLIGKGLTTAQVAGQLHLSIHTIETYRQRIKSKLDIRTGAELASAATQWVLENG